MIALRRQDLTIRAGGQRGLAAIRFSGGWPSFTFVSTTTPWSKQAPYLLARSYIREATLGATGDKAFSPDLISWAEERLQAILADVSLTTIHPAAQSLLDYVEARLHPRAGITRTFYCAWHRRRSGL